MTAREVDGEASVTGSRRRVAVLIVAFLLAAQAYAIWCDREMFPFSNYGMFSRPAEDKMMGLFAETASGGELRLADEYIRPFSNQWLDRAFRLLLKDNDPDRRTARVRDALADVLQRYERRRLDHQHDGPAIASVRLYAPAPQDTPTKQRQLLGQWPE